MRTFLFFIISFLFADAYFCARPPAGMYRGVLLLDKARQTELPFVFEISYKRKNATVTIYNAEERIKVDNIRMKGDSFNFRMPVFDTEFRTVVTQSGLKGVWINHYRRNENVIPFVATFGQESRFSGETSVSEKSIEGKWECTFSHENKKPDKALGLFHHIEQTNHISGTFLTETGDYRFLEGILRNDTLLLSTFDGSHAFLFSALLRKDSLVKGIFYSGSHWQQQWQGHKNPDFSLRDPEEITFLTDSSKTVSFAFKNTRGKIVSLTDRRFHGRPVILQIMGSWCPNCMDESRYLAQLHDQYKKAGLAVIALAFEKTADEKKALRQLKWMQQRLNITYDILLTGATGKEQASKTLPALNGITAFPTTIFLDRNHKIVKIHTGFSGPATGREFDNFKLKTETLVQNLLK